MSRTRPASRQHSRQVALQVLYALDLARPAPEEAASCAEEAFDRVAGNFELPEGARAFARELSVGTAADLERIDQLLATHARNWRVSRMAVVDRNLLRLAVYELTHTDTPASVVLDEAIELARRFGSDSSPAFVNGVLDGVAHGVAAGSSA